MKKKLLVMLVAVMCIMLCACGSNETNNSNTENNQNNSEVSTEEEGFSIVGKWKFESTGSLVTFFEDGTYESYLGPGFKYELKLDSNKVSIDLAGCGLPGSGMQDFDIVEENGSYKMDGGNGAIVLVPAE